ncbi:MAG: MMPL family transporter [Gammaproteobacteria bacterium]|nr:MMPL family transporter [Gammaproteobacteria bacterium]MDH5801870.1 MMPL family transporter [Gammaproteobacteria bacterium]
MKKMLSDLGRVFERLPDGLRNRRWWIWSGFLLSLVLLLPGAGKFELDLSDEQFFREQDPVRAAYDRFRAHFGGDESIYIVYRPKDGDLFSDASLKALQGIQEELLNYRAQLAPGESSPFDRVTDVTTLLNVSYLEASDDALIARPFIGQDLPVTQAQRALLKRQALEHPIYPMVYISPDGSYGGILIHTDFKATKVRPATEVSDISLDNIDMDAFDVTKAQSSSETLYANSEFEFVTMEEYARVTKAIYAVIYKSQYLDVLEYFPMGAPVVNTYVLDEMAPQVNMVMAISLLLIIVIQWFLFRSLSAVVWPQLIIIVSAAMVVATLGWLGITMNLMINVVILLVMVVGVADSVHILSGYMYFRNQGQVHEQALRSTFRKSGVAVLLTTLTTGLGMLSLTIVPLVPIQNMGIAAALGVFFAFVMSIVILPLMLDIWNPVGKRGVAGHHRVQKWLRRIEHWGYEQPKLNITVFAVIMVVFLVGVSKVEVDSNFMELFDTDSPIRIAQETAEAKMGGTMGMELMVSSETDDTFRDPQVLNAMDGFQQWLRTTYPDVMVRIYSIVDVVKDANRSLNGGREEAYSVPQDEQVLRQTLFMFSNANPKERRRVVSDTYRDAHITLLMKNRGTKSYIAMVRHMQQELEQRFAPLKERYPQLNVTPTGGLVLMIKILDFVSWSQIRGFSLALLAISVVLLLTFRSVRVGLLALFPNLLPLSVVFGLMGYLGIPLDADTLIVAPVMIGIVVDDTIHFLTHYRALMEEKGDIDAAIVDSFREVGQAITFTTVILLGAFLAFGLLDHQGIKNFGLLAGVAVATALAGDLLLLPALLKVTRSTFGFGPAQTASRRTQSETVASSPGITGETK